MIETRLAEFRVEGRRLVGVAMPYGEISPEHRERFEPGAFGDVRLVPVNLQHDRSVTVGEGELTDGPDALRVSLEVPAGYRDLVRRGALNGFSVEFRATDEVRVEGVRVVRAADLLGLALVDRGSYRGATAEVRARSPERVRRWL